MEEAPFHYRPSCMVPGCGRVAQYKVAAPWSNGNVAELKNYGSTCDEHQLACLERARKSRAELRLALGELVGEVGLYALRPGRRDAELIPVPH
jgi:hypothetical protein